MNRAKQIAVGIVLAWVAFAEWMNGHAITDTQVRIEMLSKEIEKLRIHTVNVCAAAAIDCADAKKACR